MANEGRRTLIAKIAAFSKVYKTRILHEGEAYELAKKCCTNACRDVDVWTTVKGSSWLALIFVLDRAFYQGRRDELSGAFELAAIAALKKILEDPWSDLFVRKIENYKRKEFLDFKFKGKGNEGWESYREKWGSGNPLIPVLEDKYPIREKERQVGKPRDREMIVSTLNLISESARRHDYNFLKYSVEKIRDGEIQDLHGELTEIRQISEKIASLILRDIVLIFLPELDSEEKLGKEDYELLQPIDTWVRQITRKYLSLDGKGDRKLRKSIVEACLRTRPRTSPILFNAGAWYLGKHSLDIAMEYLRKK